MKYSERMYPVSNIIQKLRVEEDEYDVELRAPKWDEVIKAEGRATVLLKDIIKNPTDAKGMPLPLPPHELRVLNMQTGIELAKVCVLRVGDVSTAEQNFWDRQPVPLITALGSMVMDLLWETEVGRKNSTSQPERRVIYRKIRKSEPGAGSTTPSSGESSSNGSYSETVTVGPTSVK
jgi:hypothetical protein